MKLKTSLMAGLGLLLMALNAMAGSTQDCIVEGTVKGKSDVENGTSVYIDFHSAKDAAGPESCQLNKRSKMAFKEPKNALIENVPAGSKVRYHYQQPDTGKPQWQLMDVSY
jgi:hypothetical protein